MENKYVPKRAGGGYLRLVLRRVPHVPGTLSWLPVRQAGPALPNLPQRLSRMCPIPRGDVVFRMYGVSLRTAGELFEHALGEWDFAPCGCDRQPQTHARYRRGGLGERRNSQSTVLAMRQAQAVEPSQLHLQGLEQFALEILTFQMGKPPTSGQHYANALHLRLRDARLRSFQNNFKVKLLYAAGG